MSRAVFEGTLAGGRRRKPYAGLWGLRTLASPAFSTTVLVLVATICCLALLLDSISLSLVDFGAYYQGGSDWLHGIDPYTTFLHKHLDVPAGFRGGYIYPPYTLPLFSALALLGYTWAARLWVLLEIAALGAIITMLGGVSRPRQVAACTIVVLIFLPTANSFAFGQIGVMVLAAVLAAFELVRLGRSNAAGLALGLAAAVKFFPLVAVVPYIVRGRLRPAFVAGATVAGLTLVSWAWTRELWPEYLNGIVLGKSAPSLSAGNQSLAAAVARLMPGSALASLFEVALPLALIVSVVAVLWLTRRCNARLSFALVLATLPLIVPNGLQHYYIFTVPLLWILLAGKRYRRSRLALPAFVFGELMLSVIPSTGYLWGPAQSGLSPVLYAALVNSSAIGGLLLVGAGALEALHGRRALAAEPADQFGNHLVAAEGGH